MSLWMPWYGIHIPASLRGEIDAQAGALPAGFAEFARGLLAAIPQNLHVTAWQAFGGADVGMAFLAGGLVLLAYVATDRTLSVAAALGLVVLVAFHMIDPPGAGGVATLKAGPWLALLGAGLALAPTLMSEDATEAPVPLWTAPAAEPSASVPPPR